MNSNECDLLIIGGGPAALSAAINASSEGLLTTLIDSGPSLGGQASKSALIENYPGFPRGISGDQLLGHFVVQARTFGTRLLCPLTAVSLRKDGDHRVVATDDAREFRAKMILLGIGLSYRHLEAEGVGPLMGRGVLYGSPTVNPQALGECMVYIVGGANSAGQAALNMARNPQAKIKLLVRKTIGAQMSQYLIDRIRTISNIEVIEGAQVTEVLGEEKLEQIRLNISGVAELVAADHLLIFIGAAPKTYWLDGSVQLDEKKFIITGPKLVEAKLWEGDRQPLPFETTMSGVFACGDVRLGSTKRMGAAVGEGIAALASCHEYLRLQNGK